MNKLLTATFTLSNLLFIPFAAVAQVAPPPPKIEIAANTDILDLYTSEGVDTVLKNLAPYLDDEEIAEWAKPYIDILTQYGVLAGYPDGTFRPDVAITREELAAVLSIAIERIGVDLLTATRYNDVELSNQLQRLQGEMVVLKSRLSFLQNAPDNILDKENWVGISLGYSTATDTIDDQAAINLDGRIKVYEINEKTDVSMRPFVSSSSELGAAITVDYEAFKNVQVNGGFGVAYGWASKGGILNNDVDGWADQGLLTANEDFAAYVQIGVDGHLSFNTVTYANVRLPITGENAADPVLTAGFGIKF